MPVFGAVKAAAICLLIRSGFIRHERRRCRASLPLHAGLWEFVGVLDRPNAAGTFETQGLEPGDGSYMLP